MFALPLPLLFAVSGSVRGFLPSKVAGAGDGVLGVCSMLLRGCVGVNLGVAHSLHVLQICVMNTHTHADFKIPAWQGSFN